jgi:hypothetical protein
LGYTRNWKRENLYNSGQSVRLKLVTFYGTLGVLQEKIAN